MTPPNELTPDTLRAGAPAARRLGMIITADYMERHADAWAEQLRQQTARAEAAGDALDLRDDYLKADDHLRTYIRNVEARVLRLERAALAAAEEEKT